MKVLVTGSSGHSGKAIVRLLEKEGHQSIGLDIVLGPTTNVIGNINDRDLLDRIIRQVDVIIHTASLHAPHVPRYSRADFVDINVQGTLNLLELGKKHGIQKLIYTSTTSVYGQALEHPSQAVWVTEDVQPVPRDIYDITKLAAEQLCEDVYRAEQLPTICLRVSRFWNEPLQDRLWYRMYRGLDVRDVAQAHLLAMNQGAIGFGIFNISGQSPFSQEDLLALKTDPSAVIQQKAPEVLAYFEERNWEIPSEIDRVYVIEKAKKILGYAPRINSKEIIAELKG